MPLDIVEEIRDIPASEEVETLSMSVLRISSGLRIQATSKILEEFFKSVAPNQNPTDLRSFNQIFKAYALPRNGLFGKYQTPLNAAGTALIIQDDFGNMTGNFSFLRVIGLEDGLKIEIPGPFSTEHINLFTSEVQKFVDYLGDNYLNNYSTTLRLTSRITRTA